MAFTKEVPKLAVFIVVAVMLLLPQNVVYGLPFTGTPGVGIQDDTGGDIVVHCLSKDNDLGTRTMHPGDVWNWTFKPNLAGTTLFWCSFSWFTNGNTLTASFNVWDIDVAPIYDKSVNDWKVLPDGFTLYDFPSNAWVHRHNWGTNELAHEPNERALGTNGG